MGYPSVRRCETCGRPVGCAHCGAPVRAGARFCTPAHRYRGYRRRRLGLPEHVYPGAAGARRGRTALGQLTQLEEEAAERLGLAVRDLRSLLADWRPE
jgi:hypothetical protein